MTKTWCVGGRHYSWTANRTVPEKVDPKNEKLVEVIKRKCDNSERNKCQIFTK